MSDIVIKVEGLGKQYRIGALRASHNTFTESLGKIVKLPFQRVARLMRGQAYGATDLDQIIWALKDVSLEVKRGESIGIIGGNGAGKTTLLKILSRITEPTKGRAEIRGRVGSLLEVGTGFHPELTGRENIYLNGAILGMKYSVIRRKFDDMVAFAEIEKFIDTPVKFYSSGMYVRLAFAVAAHLDPEILLVDEVLAVGDVGFQKKCLGKMEDVTKGGRTILFVSHNMNAILALCDRAIYLENGQIAKEGSSRMVVRTYMDTQVAMTNVPLDIRKDRTGSGKAQFISVGLSDIDGKLLSFVASGELVRIVLEYQSEEPLVAPSFALGVYNRTGICVFHCNSRITGTELGKVPLHGYALCIIGRLPLPSDVYTINIVLRDHGATLDYVRSAAKIDVREDCFFGTSQAVPASWGLCLVDHSWEVRKEL